MDKFVCEVMEKRIEKTIKNLEKNNFFACHVKTRGELIEKVEELVPAGSQVSFGGSVSIVESGVLEYLRSRDDIDLLDREKNSDKALEIHAELSKYFMVDFDEAGSIGKRYRRQDEIGTPLCITYDFDSEVDNCVTVRDRDTMEQVRIPISELKSFIEKKIEF